MSSPAKPTHADLEAEALAQDISAEMPSPYCPGRSIASCPSDSARELENDILALAQQGKNREQIEAVLVQRFGEEKMGSAHQNEIVIAILVSAALALAVILLAARKWLRPSVEPVGAVAGAGAAVGAAALTDPALLAQVSPDELDRLEDELDDIEGV